MIIKDSITRVVVEAKLNVSENVNYAMKMTLLNFSWRQCIQTGKKITNKTKHSVP